MDSITFLAELGHIWSQGQVCDLEQSPQREMPCTQLNYSHFIKSVGPYFTSHHMIKAIHGFTRISTSLTHGHLQFDSLPIHISFCSEDRGPRRANLQETSI